MEKIVRYDDFKLYDILDIINSLKKNYKLDINELENLFNDYNIVEWDDIEEYLVNNNIDVDEIEEKCVTYQVYEDALGNLSSKGLELIQILKYLANLRNVLEHNDKYEEMLESVDIYHYSSILKGVDINKILIVLYHLLKEFYIYLDKINSFDTYMRYEIDKFALIYGGDKIIPNRSLIICDDDYNINLSDKTSLISKKKVRSKISN